MINKAYLILAHKDLNHLLRLIDKLDDGNSFFYIHIDLKTSIDDGILKKLLIKNVVLVERVNTKWGDITLVDATLNTMKAAKDSGINFHSIILLSGQDYPIKSNRYIDNYLLNSPAKIFMDYFPLPNYESWAEGGTYRYKKYYFGNTKSRFLAAKVMNLLATLIPPLSRAIPPDLKHFCGSQWWIIDNYGLNFILDYLDKNPKYLRFHRFTFAPDEMFFQTIVINAEDTRIKNSIENNNRRFMKRNGDNPHPEILTKLDKDEILKSEALFARKFDGDKSSTLLDMLDKAMEADGLLPA